MKNNEDYKNISVSSLGISSRIKSWADEKHIETLYELIQELDALTESNAHAVIPDTNDASIDNIIILNDENGNDVPFEFLDLIRYNEDDYVVLLPVSNEDNYEADEVVILKVIEDADGDNEEYISVESEEILQKVFDIFKDKFKDEFNFV